ncbi:MAG: hypothetical protein Q9160_000454 [Pyrenula sp. 1 TL-2023]
MQFTMKTVLLATLLTLGVSAVPAPEPQDMATYPDDLTTSDGRNVNDVVSQFEPTAARCAGGFPPQKLGSRCGNQSGIFTCSLDCQKIITCDANTNKWILVAKCGGPTKCKFLDRWNAPEVAESMADPLSDAANVIAVAGTIQLADQVLKSLKRLLTLVGAQGRILWLLNKVTSLQRVLYLVHEAEERIRSDAARPSLERRVQLQHLVRQAEEAVSELQQLVDSLILRKDTSRQQRFTTRRRGPQNSSIPIPENSSTIELSSIAQPSESFEAVTEDQPGHLIVPQVARRRWLFRQNELSRVENHVQDAFRDLHMAMSAISMTTYGRNDQKHQTQHRFDLISQNRGLISKLDSQFLKNHTDYMSSGRSTSLTPQQITVEPEGVHLSTESEESISNMIINTHVENEAVAQVGEQDNISALVPYQEIRQVIRITTVEGSSQEQPRTAADAVLHKILRDGAKDIHQHKPLEALLEEVDFSRDMHFSPIHMVVLHLVEGASLDQQLKLNFRNKDQRDWSGRTPVMWGAIRRDVKAVNKLLKSGVDTKVTDNQGRTALHHAARRCSPQCASKLLKADSGALANARDNGGCTPIYWTSTSKEPLDLLVSILVRQGADIDYPDRQGRTALHRAAALKNDEMVRTLLDNGADVHIRATSGETPADAAATAENDPLERKLRLAEEKPGAVIRRDSGPVDGLAVFDDARVEPKQKRQDLEVRHNHFVLY